MKVFILFTIINAGFIVLKINFMGNLSFKEMSDWIQKIKTLFGYPVSSARVVGRWGLAYTLSQMMIPKNKGATIECNWDPFQERLYEVVVSVPNEEASNFEGICEKLNLHFLKIGQTAGDLFDFKGSFSVSISEIQRAFKSRPLSKN